MPTADQLKFLWEEYRLLQDKMDKIGDFRFRVKSWLVVLVTAFVASSVASQLEWWAYCLGVVFVLLFALLEKHQISYQQGFARRALVIEDYLQREPAVVAFQPIPKVHPEDRKKYESIPPTGPGNAVELVNLFLKRTPRGKAIYYADRVVYGVLIAMIATAGVASALLRKPPGPQRIEIVRPVEVQQTVKGDAGGAGPDAGTRMEVAKTPAPSPSVGTDLRDGGSAHLDAGTLEDAGRDHSSVAPEQGVPFQHSLDGGK